MQLQDELNQRLKILEEGGLISSEVTACCKEVINMVLEEKEDVDEEKMSMFVTHLAMALQRVLNKQDENPVDEGILETIKTEPVYPKAAEFSKRMLEICIVEFPQTEKDFLKVHLCNLFS